MAGPIWMLVESGRSHGLYFLDLVSRQFTSTFDCCVMGSCDVPPGCSDRRRRTLESGQRIQRHGLSRSVVLPIHPAIS